MSYALLYRRPDGNWWVAGAGHEWTELQAQEAALALPPELPHKVVREGGADHKAARVHDNSDDPNT